MHMHLLKQQRFDYVHITAIKTDGHLHTHTLTHSDGMLYRPIMCGIIGVEVLIYVQRFNMNITLTPKQTIKELN